MPGCVTYGKDIDEAIIMAKEAIELYIESLVAHNEPVPDESNMLEYALTLEATVWAIRHHSPTGTLYSILKQAGIEKNEI